MRKIFNLIFHPIKSRYYPIASVEIRWTFQSEVSHRVIATFYINEMCETKIKYDRDTNGISERSLYPIKLHSFYHKIFHPYLAKTGWAANKSLEELIRYTCIVCNQYNDEYNHVDPDKHPLIVKMKNKSQKDIKKKIVKRNNNVLSIKFKKDED